MSVLSWLRNCLATCLMASINCYRVDQSSELPVLTDLLFSDFLPPHTLILSINGYLSRPKTSHFMACQMMNRTLSQIGQHLWPNPNQLYVHRLACIQSAPFMDQMRPSRLKPADHILNRSPPWGLVSATSSQKGNMTWRHCNTYKKIPTLMSHLCSMEMLW